MQRADDGEGSRSCCLSARTMRVSPTNAASAVVWKVNWTERSSGGRGGGGLRIFSEELLPSKEAAEEPMIPKNGIRAVSRAKS